MRGEGGHIAAMFFLLTCSAFSQEMPDTTGAGRVDTARIYPVPEIVVEAGSLVERETRSTQPIAVITRAQLEAINARDLGDAVARAPGAFVRQYGGPGGLRTLSLRGASAQGTVMLIDGVRYRSSADGAFDLSNIPAAALERVEVVRGGAAALYGSNSLGGAVNVITGGPRTTGTTWGTELDAGSFGEYGVGASVADGGAQGFLDASFHLTRADGDYPFAYDQFGETVSTRRENADFTNLFGRAAWSYRDDGWRTAVTAIGFRSERGTPGAVVQGNLEQRRARLDESDLFVVGSAGHSWGEWDGSLAVSGRLNRLDYRDPDARSVGPDGIDDRYNRREGALNLRVRGMAWDNGVVEATAEVGYAGLNGDNLDPSAGSHVDRLQAAGAISTNWLFDSLPFNSQFVVDAAFRFDYFSDMESALSPSVGFSLRPGALPLRVRGRGALNYRAPSFTEQYYLNYGNTDLRPERSRSLDVGLTYEFDPEFGMEAGGFLIDTRDQIVGVPRSPISWSADNVGRVVSQWLESAAYGTFLDRLIDLRFSYTLMTAIDRSGGETDGERLVYAPDELLSGSCEARIEGYRVGLSWQYISHRYTLPLNSPETALPHYSIIDAFASARWRVGTFDVVVRLAGSNLFDVDYQVVRNYPMPGRSFRLGIEMKYGG